MMMEVRVATRLRWVNMTPLGTFEEKRLQQFIRCINEVVLKMLFCLVIKKPMSGVSPGLVVKGGDL